MALYSQPHPKLGMMKSFSPSYTNLFIRSEHLTFPLHVFVGSCLFMIQISTFPTPCRVEPGLEQLGAPPCGSTYIASLRAALEAPRLDGK